MKKRYMGIPRIGRVKLDILLICFLFVILLITLVYSSGVPAIESVFINTSYGLNSTLENITAFNSSATDVSSIVYDWRKNGVSDAILNMPFDVNGSTGNTSNVKDYTSYGNNGTLGNGSSNTNPTWNSSCGTFTGSGGCYQFDGINDYMAIPHSNILEPEEIALAFWINIKKLSSWQGIIMKTKSGLWNDSYNIFHQSQNDNSLNFGIGGTGGVMRFNVSLNEWIFFAATYDGNTSKVYINGVLNKSMEVNWAIPHTTTPLVIGYGTGGGTYFNGSIDEVRIYNRTLSASEIAMIYNDGIGRYNRIHSDATTKNEVWSAIVTPLNTTEEGNPVASNNLTILNTLPAIPWIYAPLNNSYTNNATLAWNASTDADNDLINYTLWVSGNSGFSGALYYNSTITALQQDISSISDGARWAKVLSFDGADNSTWSNIINFTLDTMPPSNIAPEIDNNTNFSSSTVYLNWTITDATSSIVNCRLVVDEAVNVTNIAKAVAILASYKVEGLSEGQHTWYVSNCSDSAGNSNETGTLSPLMRAFYVDLTNPEPTLSLSSTSINVLATETITCTATDRGVANPASFTVQLPNGDFSSDLDGTFTDTSVIGTYTVICSATDNSGRSASTQSTFTVGSEVTGGGGGGSSGGATTVATASVSTTISSITPGTPAVVKVSNSKIAVSEVSLNVNKAASGVKVTVAAVNTLPSSTPAAGGKVFKYLQISKENIADSNLNSAKIKFAVDRTWLTDNGMNPADVVLNRFTTEWASLPTKLITSDANKFYFEAVTPGFSLFAITAKKAVEEEVVEEATEASEEPVQEEEPETPVIAEKQSRAWAYAILIIVFGVIAAAFFFWGRQKKHRHKLHRR